MAENYNAFKNLDLNNARNENENREEYTKGCIALDNPKLEELDKNIEYNKKEGIIKKYDEEKNRYIIYVPEMDKNIFVKKENISKITSSDENSELSMNYDTDNSSTDDNN